MRNLTTTLCLTVAVLLGSAGESFALPECPTDRPVSTWSDCFGNWTINSGDWAGFKYVGEFRDGKSHGQGTYTWSAPNKHAGEKYVGEFKDGKANGQGTVTFSATHKSAGEKQVGEFRDDKLHGQGTYTWSAPNCLTSAPMEQISGLI